MKKLLTIAFTLVLGSALSIAQTGGTGTTSTDKPADKTASGKKKTADSSGKKTANKKAKSKKSSGTSTPPPK